MKDKRHGSTSQSFKKIKQSLKCMPRGGDDKGKISFDKNKPYN